MLKSLANTRLGAWVAHGEGRFVFKGSKNEFNVVSEYSYSGYPGNPTDSDFNTAAVCSTDGRHLAIMPHLERSLFPWNWPHYMEDNTKQQVSPWIEAFVNARGWVNLKTVLVS